MSTTTPAGSDTPTGIPLPAIKANANAEMKQAGGAKP